MFFIGEKTSFIKQGEKVILTTLNITNRDITNLLEIPYFPLCVACMLFIRLAKSQQTLTNRAQIISFIQFADQQKREQAENAYSNTENKNSHIHFEWRTIYALAWQKITGAQISWNANKGKISTVTP